MKTKPQITMTTDELPSRATIVALIGTRIEKRRNEMRERSIEIWGHPGSVTKVRPYTIQEIIHMALDLSEYPGE
jgi:hypothetical protein